MRYYQKKCWGGGREGLGSQTQPAHTRKYLTQPLWQAQPKAARVGPGVTVPRPRVEAHTSVRPEVPTRIPPSALPAPAAQGIADSEKCRDVYERAIANLPKVADKQYWGRYIYLWIMYAAYEELDEDVWPRMLRSGPWLGRSRPAPPSPRVHALPPPPVLGADGHHRLGRERVQGKGSEERSANWRRRLQTRTNTMATCQPPPPPGPAVTVCAPAPSVCPHAPAMTILMANAYGNAAPAAHSLKNLPNCGTIVEKTEAIVTCIEVVVAR